MRRDICVSLNHSMVSSFCYVVGEMFSTFLHSILWYIPIQFINKGGPLCMNTCFIMNICNIFLTKPGRWRMGDSKLVPSSWTEALLSIYGLLLHSIYLYSDKIQRCMYISSILQKKIFIDVNSCRQGLHLWNRNHFCAFISLTR